MASYDVVSMNSMCQALLVGGRDGGDEPGRGVTENKHSTDVALPPPPPRVL
jgi:hypothetical protein